MNLSVIVPSHNRRDLLKRALKSVSAQTLPADEVIVVDDGSTDQTHAMVRNEFPQVTYQYQENSGVSNARNRGIGQSRGEWLAFLDSDDEWLPDKLEKQMTALLDQPQLKICHTEEIWIRNGRRVNAKRKHTKQGGWIFRHCLPLCAMSPSSIIIHRSIFEHVGLFDESLPACEDYDLWLRITARYPVLFIEQPLIIKYGGHLDQLSRKYWGMDRFRITALQKIIDTPGLRQQDRQAAIAMLVDKLNIYLQGATKRGKQQEIQTCQELLHRYQAPHNEQLPSTAQSANLPVT